MLAGLKMQKWRESNTDRDGGENAFAGLRTQPGAG